MDKVCKKSVSEPNILSTSNFVCSISDLNFPKVYIKDELWSLDDLDLIVGKDQFGPIYIKY